LIEAGGRRENRRSARQRRSLLHHPGPNGLQKRLSSVPNPVPAEVATHPPVPQSDTFDDMHDSPEEMQYYSALPLAACQPITRAFESNDKAALHFQRIHRRLAVTTASLATLAVMLAILELGYDPVLRANWPGMLKLVTGAELVFAIGSGLVAFVGWIGEFKEKWLMRRHQAELCRLLKYHFLIWPSRWSASGTESQPWIQERLNEIGSLQGRQALHRAVREPAPHGPFEVTMHRMRRGVLRALTEYYLVKRLSPQKEYLANRVQRNQMWGWVGVLPPILFGASVLAVLLRSVWAVLHGSQGVSSAGSPLVPGMDWPVFLTVLAALLPAAAAGLRTFRAAFEFSRNRGRFEAAHKALSELEARVVDEAIKAGAGAAAQELPGADVAAAAEQAQAPAQARPSSLRALAQGDPALAGSQAADNAETEGYAVLGDLSWCEHILDSEHREWLRLMYEAEWFG
jgi:hypothetical protein